MPRKRKPSRPKPISIGSITARVARGPRTTDEGRQWYWRFWNGQTTIHTAWASEKRVEEIAACLLSGQSLNGASPQLFSHLFADWLNAQRARRDLKVRTKVCYENESRYILQDPIAALPLSSINLAALESFRDRGLADGRASATVYLNLRIIRTAWNWGARGGYTNGRPLPAVQINLAPARPKVTPTEKQARTILHRLTGWKRMMFSLAFHTGARRRELGELCWKDVDLTQGTIRIVGKGDRNGSRIRVLPTTADLLSDLRSWGDWNQRQPETYVLGVTPNTAGFVSKHYAPICEELGIPYFTLHGLRRLRVKLLRRAGVPVFVAAKYMGHTPAVMMKYYDEVEEEDLREAVTLLDAKTSDTRSPWVLAGPHNGSSPDDKLHQLALPGKPEGTCDHH